jgi:hypothetical protein
VTPESTQASRNDDLRQRVHRVLTSGARFLVDRRSWGEVSQTAGERRATMRKVIAARWAKRRKA